MNSVNTIHPAVPASDETHLTSFEQLYLKVRKKENRIFSDEETALLPDISLQHPHYSEWQMRKASFKKLRDYLLKMKRPMNILEIGCGNGWLSAGLAAFTHFNVTGIDVNRTELEQAKRVFGNKDNLRFLTGDIQNEIAFEDFFDIVIFAASIQYFPSLTDILNRALNLLRLNGEVHITDSHFYQPGKLEAAKRRSREYYEALGFPEMAAYYFHHSIDELNSFNYKILYQPDRIHRRLLGNKNPFYWIKIRQN